MSKTLASSRSKVSVHSCRPRVIEQLRRDAQPIARFAHAALQHVTHAQHGADPVDARVAALERKGARPPDDVQLAEPRQGVQDLLGDAVAEVVVVGIVADVDKGEHRDRIRQSLAAGARGSGRCRRRVRERRLANLLHGPDDEHGRNRGEGGQNQIVAPRERAEAPRPRLRRPGRAADAARTDLEQPAEDERQRKAQHRRPDQRLDRRVGYARTPETARRPPAA